MRLQKAVDRRENVGDGGSTVLGLTMEVDAQERVSEKKKKEKRTLG